MTGLSLKLLFLEFRKMWNLAVIIITSILLLISLFVNFIPYFVGAYNIDGPIQLLNVQALLSQGFSILVPLLSLIFGAGIISNDIKNHWIRTILSRPVTRADFLLTKIISTSLAIFVLMLIIGTIPVTILSILIPVKVELNFLSFISIHAIYLGEALTYIAICTLLSQWVPGFVNVIVLIVWILSKSIFTSIVNNYFWDSNIAMLIADFYFPGGFQEAAESVASNASFPLEKLLWGFSSLFGFISISLYNFSFIQIDKGFD
ncbi:MAG: ABC transporter permease subunit [Ignavibacteriae bacterium]|nr:ABC transporter permease subunit [Ignavibacteriota bacterium]